ncbi:MAG: tRNA (adenosine(37)-N6)-threonylcarbamoyltransferase complex ATPase subunit type 1 TsaE [Cyclobacteriaceae bacterium]|nr:tRNA (adenosine(37)-N6)-threonylcarbamoyltransferase complex ATPase subunit type 1 TsaE [Cyclobacteriaceae bacterium]
MENGILEIIADENDLQRVVEEILRQTRHEKVVLFTGDLGAGKTTLIKTLVSALDSDDRVQSPTFTLVNEYRDNQGNSIYHFDFYRIKNEREAEDMGIDEYFYSGNYCFVEWPEKIRSLLPDEFVTVRIESYKDKRKYLIEQNV